MLEAMAGLAKAALKPRYPSQYCCCRQYCQSAPCVQIPVCTLPPREDTMAEGTLQTSHDWVPVPPSSGGLMSTFGKVGKELQVLCLKSCKYYIDFHKINANWRKASYLLTHHTSVRLANLLKLQWRCQVLFFPANHWLKFSVLATSSLENVTLFK